MPAFVIRAAMKSALQSDLKNLRDEVTRRG